MDIAKLKALIEFIGGGDYVVGLRFANGYKVVYSKHLLNIDEDCITVGGMEYIKYEHYDTNGNIVLSYLPVDQIAQVYTLVDLDVPVILRDCLE